MSERRVLFVYNDDPRSSILRQILSGYGTLLRSVSNLVELQRHLEAGGYDAVFCDWSFQEGTWNDALRHVQEQYPDLPVIVFCHSGGETEWVEVLNAGAFDLLAPPYSERSVIEILEHAVSSYEGRRLHGQPARRLAAS